METLTTSTHSLTGHEAGPVPSSLWPVGGDDVAASLEFEWISRSEHEATVKRLEEKISVLAMQKWIPFIFSAPDLGKDDERKVAQRFRSLGVKAMDAPGEPEAFLQDLTQAMGQGRFKVFSQLASWIEQFRLAGNQQDKAIQIAGDLISATCLLYGARERMVVQSGATGPRPTGLPSPIARPTGLGSTWS